jgi:hypothetical protein
MVVQAAFAGNKSESKELIELRINLNTMRDFLTLVELLETLPNMQRTPYEVTRSIYQAVSSGRDVAALCRQLEGFFGAPQKMAGKSLPLKLKLHPVIKYLNGVRKDQTLFMRKTRNGSFYGALWPWQKSQDRITVHLGYVGNKMSSKEVVNFEKLAKSRVLNKKVFEELSSGAGNIQGISLPSFLHMALLEKITCTLEVRKDGALGNLYLRDGKMFAAETGELAKSEAAYEIISWDNPSIEIRDAALRKTKEIDVPLIDILSEALRRRKTQGSRPSLRASNANGASMGSVDRTRLFRNGKPAKADRPWTLIIGVSVLAVLTVTIGAFFSLGWLKSGQVEAEYRRVLEQVEALESPYEKELLLQYFIDSNPENYEFRALAREELEQVQVMKTKRHYEETLESVSNLPVDENYESEATRMYNEFLDAHPGTQFYGDIQLKLNEIPEVIDDVDFARLNTVSQLDYENRIEAYLNYLVKHPYGRHKSEVESRIADMSQEYYAHLMKEISRCDELQNWDTCILLANNFLNYFEGDHRTDEVENLRNVMLDKKEVAALMDQVHKFGNRYERAKQVLVEYLEANPYNTQIERIQEKIAMLDENIRQNREWEAVLGYVQNSDYSLTDRISQLSNYIRQNPAGRFSDQAGEMLTGLQQENRILYQSRIEEERRRQQQVRIRERQRLESQEAQMRASVAAAGSRLIQNNDGTFTDRNSGKRWVLLDSTAALNGCLDFEAAKRYVNQLETGGYKDWRMPFVSELAALYKTEPFLTGGSAPWYWSSEVLVKGYHKKALVVTSTPEPGFTRIQKDPGECGAVRAVRP